MLRKTKVTRDKIIQMMFWFTGMRNKELINLRRKDIDFDKKLGHIREGKGGKKRDFILDKKLEAELYLWLKLQNRLVDKSDDNFLFRNCYNE